MRDSLRAKVDVSSGPVVADYVTADREEELLRVLDAIGARDVVVGPEGKRVEITFVLDAEKLERGGQNSRRKTEHVRGWLLAGSGGGLKDRLAKRIIVRGANLRSMGAND